MSPGRSNLSPVRSIDELLALHDEAFVRAAYLALLGREVDPVGLAGYVQQLRQGVAKTTLVSILALSPESAAVASPLPGLNDFARRHRPRPPGLWARAMRRLGRLMLADAADDLRALSNNLEALRLRVDQRQVPTAGAQALPTAMAAPQPEPLRSSQLQTMAEQGAASPATGAAAVRLAAALRAHGEAD